MPHATPVRRQPAMVRARGWCSPVQRSTVQYSTVQYSAHGVRARLLAGAAADSANCAPRTRGTTLCGTSAYRRCGEVCNAWYGSTVQRGTSDDQRRRHRAPTLNY
eukprot:405091-Pyramimonas_sp.AAC.1